MRLGSILREGQRRLGLVCDEKVLILNEVARRTPSRYGALAAARDVDPLWTAATRRLIYEIHETVHIQGMPPDWLDCCEAAASVVWQPPVAAPEKIICIGLNYRDHAAESKMELPKEPIFFNKFNSALAPASGPVVLPLNSKQVDYEAELAVVLGKEAKRVSEYEARECIGGYTVMNDVSARDWQFRTGQWVHGKTFDTFAPCGPYLVTPEDVPDPHNLGIRLTLNGQVMQESNTRHLVFGVPVLISFLSQIFTLKPGDIISTGTPPGVGFARRPPVFLQDGDVIEVLVEQVGTMRHRCVAER